MSPIDSATPVSNQPASSSTPKEVATQFEDMVRTRPVEMETDQNLIFQETVFADELVIKLNEMKISPKTLTEFVEAINTFDFKNSAILQDSNLPYFAVEALRKGLIDSQQAGTVLNFWSARQYHTTEKLETVQLFDTNGSLNPKATEYLKKTLSRATPITFLDDDKKFGAFITAIRSLPPSEQRLLIVPDVQEVFIVSQAINNRLVNVFCRFQDPETYQFKRMVPSVGMMQAFLNAQYDEPVQIKPRIYLSTEMQIREGGCTHTRDMMMPFPDTSGQNRCPTIADGHNAPWYDFPYHDFYHEILASACGKNIREASIMLADILTKSAGNNPKVKALAAAFIDMDYIKCLQSYHDKSKSTTPAQAFRMEIYILLNRLPATDQIKTLKIVYDALAEWNKTKGIVDGSSFEREFINFKKSDILGPFVFAVEHMSEEESLRVLDTLLKEDNITLASIPMNALLKAAEKGYHSIVKKMLGDETHANAVGRLCLSYQDIAMQFSKYDFTPNVDKEKVKDAVADIIASGDKEHLESLIKLKLYSDSDAPSLPNQFPIADKPDDDNKTIF